MGFFRKWATLILRGFSHNGRMPDIIPWGNYRCVEHGISVMRMALGYDTALPEGWSYEVAPTGMFMRDILDLFRKSFPNRDTHIYIPDPFVPDFLGTKPLSKISQDLTNALDYLLAFGYTTKSTEESHFVIGAPVTYGGELQVKYVLAVSIKPSESLT